MKGDDMILLHYLIKNHLPFRLGQRGICIDFHFNGRNWTGKIPRADVYLLFSILRVSADGETLSCETPGFNPMRITLTSYDKLTISSVYADSIREGVLCHR